LKSGPIAAQSRYRSVFMAAIAILRGNLPKL
jgi:hypothetical protein